MLCNVHGDWQGSWKLIQAIVVHIRWRVQLAILFKIFAYWLSFRRFVSPLQWNDFPFCWNQMNKSQNDKQALKQIIIQALGQKEKKKNKADCPLEGTKVGTLPIWRPIMCHLRSEAGEKPCHNSKTHAHSCFQRCVSKLVFKKGEFFNLLQPQLERAPAFAFCVHLYASRSGLITTGLLLPRHPDGCKNPDCIQSNKQRKKAKASEAVERRRVPQAKTSLSHRNKPKEDCKGTRLWSLCIDWVERHRKWTRRGWSQSLLCAKLAPVPAVTLANGCLYRALTGTKVELTHRLARSCSATRNGCIA